MKLHARKLLPFLKRLETNGWTEVENIATRLDYVKNTYLCRVDFC